MDDIYVQTLLRSGTTMTTCWLPKDSRVKAGSVITLKGSDTKWQVVRQFKPEMPRHLLKTDWKVGGLS